MRSYVLSNNTKDYNKPCKNQSSSEEVEMCQYAFGNCTLPK